MRASLVVFFTVLIACLAVAGGHLYSPDDEVLFRVTQSVATRGEISIRPIEQDFATMRGREGRSYAQYGVLQPIVAAPLVWAGNWFDGQYGESMRDVVFDERSEAFGAASTRQFTQRFAVSFFNSFVTAALAAALCFFAWKLTRQFGVAVFTGLVYGLATLALPHSRTYFTEPLSTLLVFIALGLLHSGVRSGGNARIFLAGLIGGAAVLARVDSAVALPALLLYGLWSFWPAGFRSPMALFESGDESNAEQTASIGVFWKRAMLLALPLSMGPLCLAGLNFYRFKSVLETGYGDQPEGVAFATPLLVGLHGLLFSPGRGLFFFSPPLILSIWAFPALARLDRRLAWSVGALVVSVLCFHAKWGNWSGGWCWGPRHIYMIHIFLTLPLAAWIAEGTNYVLRKRLLLGFFVIGFGVQIYGSSQDFIRYYRVFFFSPNPKEQAIAHALYIPREEMAHLGAGYKLVFKTPEGDQQVFLNSLGAPSNDSLYVPQHSCWYGYREMARQGWHDNLWLRLSLQ